MSIEELANVQVTSVSKRAEPVSDAPAAVYVITHDDIVQSRAATLPEILRLAPNLQVAAITASSYAITARGFNGNAANKLLVLIDGRSVYTPLFGGVLWDEQVVPPDDIDRIEVISGPGATLWGANAMNGVINIITRRPTETPAGSAEVNIGDHASTASLQYEGALREGLRYRVYGTGLLTRHDQLSTGADGHDGLSQGRGGFRLDWSPARDTASLQGELYFGREQQPALSDLKMSGGHLQLNWRHALAGESALGLLAYFDENRRFAAPGNGFYLRTYDLELQHNFSLGHRHQIVWGFGGRLYQDHFANTGPVAYLPPERTEALVDVFAQDTIALTGDLELTAGLKLEKDPYVSFSALPNARLSWKPVDGALLWGAVSRAVRAPTRFDVDLHDVLNPFARIQGNPDFQTEKLTAYELGGRARLGGSASLSVSAYYNVYDDLRSVELPQTAPVLVLQWGNFGEARTYGVEAWGDYQPLAWWRLSAGLKVQHLDIRFRPGASAVNSAAALGDDANSQASVRATMLFGHGLSWQAGLRYVGALPNPRIPSYTEIDTDLIWAVTDRVQLSISGANLVHPRHLEYELAGATIGTEVPRSFSIGAKLRF